MSMQGVTGGADRIGYGLDRPAMGSSQASASTARPEVRPESGVAAQPQPSVVRPESGTETRAVAPSSESAEPSGAAPPGTDPELWSVLTTEERAYYERAQAMGPLTYSPGTGGAASDSVALGGRIDVRA